MERSDSFSRIRRCQDFSKVGRSLSSETPVDVEAIFAYGPGSKSSKNIVFINVFNAFQGFWNAWGRLESVLGAVLGYVGFQIAPRLYP